MGKKRKASGRNTQASGPQELNEKDAQLGPITSYEDVADSEDEFFMNRDKLMLDGIPNSKRRRKDDDSDMELSDEEILGYDDDDDSNNDQIGQDEPSSKSRKDIKDASRGTEVRGEDDEEDDGYWGSSKREYYNADQIETEADALEEEAEAKRLQKRKLSKMVEEDFIFDGDEWLGVNDDAEEGGLDTVTEVLRDVEIPKGAGREERQRILAARYPEFGHLGKELEELHPVLEALREEAKNQGTSLVAVRYWVLGCYIASLASYFAILTSPTRDGSKTAAPLDPAELRDHEVMETLVECRNAWQRIRDVLSVQDALVEDEDEDETELPAPALEQAFKKTYKANAKKDKVAAKKLAEKAARDRAIEASIADLYNLPLTNGSTSKKRQKAVSTPNGDDSDFGEEDTLDARTAADKAARKKSLKFYTSQIAQKANKRAGAGRDAGGDMDIPYRERLRDRQTRLLAEAEKRGKRDSKFGADLGDDSDEEDSKNAKAMRDDEDGYYDMVAHSAKNKKDDKAVRYAAYAAAAKGDRVVENEEIGEDGKRKISYAIEKNKGLTPRRKKDVRNPRVKKKKQYESKQKKLRSMKPVWKGGEPKGGYQGESSGINTGVIKSVKL